MQAGLKRCAIKPTIGNIPLLSTTSRRIGRCFRRIEIIFFVDYEIQSMTNHPSTPIRAVKTRRVRPQSDTDKGTVKRLHIRGMDAIGNQEAPELLKYVNGSAEATENEDGSPSTISIDFNEPVRITIIRIIPDGIAGNDGRPGSALHPLS